MAGKWVLICAAAVGVVLAVGAAEGAGEPWAGPSFREFSGTVQGNPAGPLWNDSLSWDRHDLSWGGCEPRQGEWNQEYLEDYGKRVLKHRKRSAYVLPILCYTAEWAYDRSERTLEHQGTRWVIQPRADGRFNVTKLTRTPEQTWKETDRSVQNGSANWALAAEHVKDWESYVRRAVSFLRKAPYNVEYFQIWNEAWPTSGFWFGDMDTYMTRVHLPAAKIIHELGGKVVYGGWPCCATLAEFVSLLDKHRAWDSVDVLDIHYFPVSGFQFLYDAARKRGYSRAIWQTEIGFTEDPGFVGNTYPRALHWALRHNWDRPDMYKIFMFAYWSPDDPKAFGYHRTFYSGEKLGPHGQSLQTLGELLKGQALRAYGDVTSNPALVPQLSETQSSLEAFRIGKRIVVAVHLWQGSKDDSVHLDSGLPGIAIQLPKVKPSDVRMVERCSLTGERVDLTNGVKVLGPGLSVAVPIREAEASPVQNWLAQTGPQVRTFFVAFELK